MSRNGNELPNVRILRTSLFPDKDIPDDLNLLMVMQWGQLIAHDTTHIVQQDSGSYIHAYIFCNIINKVHQHFFILS